MKIDLKALVEKLAELSEEAGRAILEVYADGEAEVTYKEDLSPLTLADRNSHNVIVAGLARLAPDIPVLSEEGASAPYSERRGWERFFLVDPLDGTKEFIKRNGEFTVNIALIEGTAPVMGVIHVPVSGDTYFAAQGTGAFKRGRDGKVVQLKVAGAPRAGRGLTVVASRSHGSDALEEYLTGVPVAERISKGSSLKFCLVAEGLADIYPRFGPTWEWDTASGHAILLEAGGLVTDTGGSTPLAYNKETPKHPGFIAWGGVRARDIGK